MSNVVPFAPPTEQQDLPHSTDSERALLGALMIDNEQVGTVAAMLRPEHFYWQDHQDLFACITALAASGRPATAITVKAYLQRPEIAGMPAMEYLAALCTAATTTNAPGYAAIVRDHAVRRALVTVAERLEHQARFGGAEVSGQALIEEAESDLLAARAVTPASHLAGMTAGEGAAWMLDRIETIRAGQMRSSAISSGVADLDRATNGGFQRGQLWLVAGRPGMGKTVAMTSLSRYAAREVGVLVFQLEVTRDQQFARYLADLSYVHNRPLTFGQIMKGVNLTDEDFWRLQDAKKRLDQLHLKVECEPSISIAQLTFAVKAEKKRLAKQGVELGVVFIDYLKYIKVSDRYRGQRVLEIGETAGALKQLAKSEDICIVLLAQLNRQVEAHGREDRRPSAADLRDSGELEEAADSILLLYRDAFYLQRKLKGSADPEISARFLERQHCLEIILGKNRSGPECTLNLWVDVASSTIAQHARGPA